MKLFYNALAHNVSHSSPAAQKLLQRPVTQISLVINHDTVIPPEPATALCSSIESGKEGLPIKPYCVGLGLIAVGKLGDRTITFANRNSDAEKDSQYWKDDTISDLNQPRITKLDYLRVTNHLHQQGITEFAHNEVDCYSKVVGAVFVRGDERATFQPKDVPVFFEKVANQFKCNAGFFYDGKALTNMSDKFEPEKGTVINLPQDVMTIEALNDPQTHELIEEQYRNNLLRYLHEIFEEDDPSRVVNLVNSAKLNAGYNVLLSDMKKIAHEMGADFDKKYTENIAEYEKRLEQERKAASRSIPDIHEDDAGFSPRTIIRPMGQHPNWPDFRVKAAVKLVSMSDEVNHYSGNSYD